MLILIVKLLKISGLLKEVIKINKSLAPEKHLIKVKLEMFNDTITPGFSNRNKDRFYTQI